MKKLFILLLAALPLAVIAQDRVINDSHAEARSVGSFHAIKVSTGIQLIMKQGTAEAVAISAEDKETRDNIKTEVVNGVLKIYYDYSGNNWWKGNMLKGKHLKAYVSFRNIDKFSGSSGSNTTVDGSMTAAGLDINLSSGAHFKGNVKADGLGIDQSSGSHMNISGQAQRLTIETSSGAHFYGYDIASDKCRAGASSGGRIEVTVNRELDASASSGGGIHYKGSGVITRVSTSSGGRIQKDS